MFLLIDKPKGITSHDVVDKVRKITAIRRVGHAGTLDPNATGLLIVGIGRVSTKKLGDLSRKTFKIYEAEITLGEERDTDDIEGKTIRKTNLPVPNMKEIHKAVNSFVGTQKQVPPQFSAIKTKGKKAYELARAGKTVKFNPRTIIIDSIDINHYKYPVLKITTTVSSGTYIRSLARDIGKKLNTGAYLANIKRLAIGKFNLKNSVQLDNLTSDNWKNFTFEI